jgi:hypothetical protein
MERTPTPVTHRSPCTLAPLWLQSGLSCSCPFVCKPVISNQKSKQIETEWKSAVGHGASLTQGQHAKDGVTFSSGLLGFHVAHLGGLVPCIHGSKGVQTLASESLF